MKRAFLITACLAAGFISKAQMVIQSGAVLFIEGGAKVTLQGDLTASANIQGTGTVQMKGTGAQNLNMNGFTVPNLEIDNAADVTLTGNTRVGTNLLFTAGKLKIGNLDLLIGPAATINGGSATRFIWTGSSATGQVKKELTADITNFEIPVGEGNTYRPAYLTSTGATYSSAVVGVRNVSGSSGNKPPMMANFVSSYWPVTKTGISNGIQTLTGQYADADIASSDETLLSGYYFNGTEWTSVSASQDNAANRITAPVVSASGELTGMNKFIAVGAKAFLQGAFSTANGLMSDALRSGTNVIPMMEPYRDAPYSFALTTPVNLSRETVTSSLVFDKQASDGDDIVDWVFLELRNTLSPGNAILQTRSALIQRDGDIVDVDGKSPVTFNNLTNGNYTIAVRHRNHLGLSTNPASPRTFTESRLAAIAGNLADLTAASTSLFGVSGTNYTTGVVSSTTVNMLWSGNANSNANVRYNGPTNDRDYLLSFVLAGNQGDIKTPIYSPGDLNMNKTVRYNGPQNDRDFLLLTPLAGNQGTIRSQALPN